MQTTYGLESLRRLPPGLAVSIGNFDGIHRGHARILEIARQEAAGVAAITFEPHPLTVLKPAIAPPRLTPPMLKHRLLEEAGVQHLVILPPEPSVLNLSAEDFWAILRDDVRPACLVEGPSFNFGKGRGGNIHRLREWSAGTNVRLVIVEPLRMPLLDLTVVEVSSSMIRWLLSNGRARDAAICLGRPYVLEGQVIRGFERGRKIGFPTANLDCADQLIPLDGVYVGRCAIDGTAWPAALSIGTLPTFGEHKRQVEAYLAGFDGDLYNRTIQIEVIDWMRDQWKFAGVEALKAQLAKDVELTLQRCGLDASRAVAALVYPRIEHESNTNQ